MIQKIAGKGKLKGKNVAMMLRKLKEKTQCQNPSKVSMAASASIFAITSVTPPKTSSSVDPPNSL